MESAAYAKASIHFYSYWIYSMSNIKSFIIVVLMLMLFSGCASSQKEQTKIDKQIRDDYQMALNYYEHGQTPEAIRSLALVLASDPKHADANHLMGFIRMGRGQFQEAEKHFKTALEVNPEMLNCKNNLGAVYLHLEQYEEAAIIFKELSQSPLYTSPWLAFGNLGWAYYQMGMTQEAIEETEMAIALNPDFCLGYNNLGIFYRSMDKIERAEANLNDAIKLCANYPEPHLHLGMIYSQRNDTVKAYTHFKKCADLTPRSDLGKRCQQNAHMMR